MSAHLPRAAALAAAFVSLAAATLPLSAGAQLAATLNWATYLGGTDADRVSAVTQIEDDTVAVGRTQSLGFEPIPTAGSRLSADIFVARFDSSGSMYTNYTNPQFPLRVFGGDGFDEPTSVAVGPDKELYIVGKTTSVAGFFGTAKVLRQARAGTDAFLARISAEGAVDWFMFLEGNADDVALGVTVVDGSVYVAGWTNSTNFLGASNNGLAGANGFVVRVEPSATNALIGWTLLPRFVGGTGDDRFLGITAGVGNKLYAVGTTTSTAFGYGNKVLNTYKGGDSDAFVAKLDIAFGDLDWVTFVGGSGAEQGNGIAAGLSTSTPQLFVVAGTTNSPNNLGSGAPLAYTSPFVAWVTDAGKLKSSQVRQGGSGEEVLAVTTDKGGNAYVGGRTASAAFQGIDIGFDTTIEAGAGYREGFLWMAPPEGGDGWASFVGGNSLDEVTSLSMSGTNINHLVLGLETSSAQGLPGDGGYDTSPSTIPDGYLLRVGVSDTSPPTRGEVFDRLQLDDIHEDVRTTTSTTSLYANWTEFARFDSDEVVRYEWAIGTREDPISIRSFRSVGKQQSAGDTELPLVVGQEYIITVRAQNQYGLTSVATSDGVLVTFPDGGTGEPDAGTGEPDGGTGEPDGGTDAGTDGGPDGGTDAGTDGGTSGTDGGGGGDSPSGEPTSPMGWELGCASAGGGAGLPLLLGLIALVLLGRRLGKPSP